MRQLVTLLVLISSIFISTESLAARRSLQSGCHDIKHPVVGGRVCVYMADRRRNPDVLYFFHGVDRRAEDWQERPEFSAMRDHWEKSPSGPPTILSVSFGPRWIMTAPREGNPGIHAAFVNEILPKLEEVIGGIGPGRRLVLGESMGGANAALLFFREARMFHRAAFLCPGFSTVSPFAGTPKILAYIHRNKANAGMALYFMGVARKMLGRADAWPPNNPLDVAPNSLGRETPPFLITCGDRDEFGFFEGSSLLAKTAKERGARIQWLPYPGGHCTGTDPKAVVDFLLARDAAPWGRSVR